MIRAFHHPSRRLDSSLDAAPVVGLAGLLAATVAATAYSPIPIDTEPETVVWAVLAIVSALAAAWRPVIGLAVLATTVTTVALRPLDVDPNEVAGVLAPAVPIAVGWWASIGRPTPRVSWLGTGIVLGLAARLMLTASRAGLLAMLAGLVVVALLAGGSRWRRRGSIGIATAVATLGGAAIAWPEALGRPIVHLAHPGNAEGWSWAALLTGRPTVWRRSLEALGDLPIWGVGPGHTDTVLAVYPLAPYGLPTSAVDDAHQAVLQLALDLGLAAASIAGVLLVIACLRALRATLGAPTAAARRLHAGLVGGLTSLVVFGSVDTVALGSPAALGGWALLGLGLAAPWSAAIRRDRISSAAASLAAMAVAVAVVLVATVDRRPLDRATRAGLRAVLDPGAADSARDALNAIADQHPEALWWLGLIENAAGRPAARDAAWSRLVAATPSRLAMLATVAPEHRPLAGFAVATWPTDAVARRWLATADPTTARPGLRRALALAPNSGEAPRLRLALGHLDESAGAVRAALDAFATACRHGDPGANACGEAGRVAESLGERDLAIAFYRQSRWPPIRQQADRLLRP